MEKQMKTFTAWCVAVLAALAVAGCRLSETNGKALSGLANPDGEKVTKEYRVDDFTKVQISGPFDVSYEQRSGKPTVVASVSGDIPKGLDIKVKGNTLYIDYKGKKSFAFRSDLKVKVTSARLDEVTLKGSGDFEQRGGLTAESMTVSISGSGDVKLNNVACAGLLKTQISGSGDVRVRQATCAQAEASISGSGDVKLHRLKAAMLKGSIKGAGDIDVDGEGQEAEYSISGSGDIDAFDFVAKNVSVTVMGAGSVRCHATDLLDVHSSGLSSVSYKGNPNIRSKGNAKLKSRK